MSKAPTGFLHSRGMKWFGISALALITGTVGVGGAYCWSTYHPVPFNKVRLNQAVQYVASHRAPGQTVVALPHGLQDVSLDGKIYLTGSSMFVPAWTGRKMLLPHELFDVGKNYCEGYLYAPSKPTYNPDNAEMPWVIVETPRGKSVPMAVPDEAPVAPHWYSVVSDPD